MAQVSTSTAMLSSIAMNQVKNMEKLVGKVDWDQEQL